MAPARSEGRPRRSVPPPHRAAARSAMAVSRPGQPAVVAARAPPPGVLAAVPVRPVAVAPEPRPRRQPVEPRGAPGTVRAPVRVHARDERSDRRLHGALADLVAPDV